MTNVRAKRYNGDEARKLDEVHGPWVPGHEALRLEEEIKRLRAALENICQERLTWGLACECYCRPCRTLDRVITEAVRTPEPETPK